MTNDPAQPHTPQPMAQPKGPIAADSTQIDLPQADPTQTDPTQADSVPVDPSLLDPAPEIPRRFERNKPPNEEVDSQLVDQTKNHIRSLVQEIADLSKSKCSVEDFNEGFLTRTTSALASIGGAIWIRDSADSPLQLHYQINLKKTRLANDPKAQSQHGRLLKKLADQGEPALISPDSGTPEDGLPGNPTEFLLLVGPLKIDNETVGLVEIFQRPGAGPTTQRGYLRFLMQMCDIASDFFRNQRIRSFALQQSMWQQLEQFIRIVHQGLDTEQTIFTLANEGRRLIDCDRVSVAIGQNRNCRIKTVSGLDSIERRAEQVKKLGQLAAAVIRTGQPLWYSGDNDDLPPQIEKKLHDYVDASHAKMLAILPLHQSLTDPENSNGPGNRPAATLGALIVEQLKDSRITPALEKRAEIVVQHGQMALTNALEHHRIFLMPLWKAIGKMTSAFQIENRLKTIGVLTALTGTLAFLALFPYEFGLSAQGSLIPEQQHEVFAQIDGTMEEVHVSDDGNTAVKKGQVLARMKNSDIELAISDITGRINETEADIKSNQQIQSRKRLDGVEQVEVENRIRHAMQTVKSLQRELQIRIDEQKLLDVVSPSDGMVVNWDVRQNLLHRPVQQGQQLMTIVPPDTQWQIELELPERRLAHLIRTLKKNKDPLMVTFGLASNPGKQYTGTLIAVDRKLDVYSDTGNTALLRVAFANDTIDPDLLRSETRVSAKLNCGTRSIGYVMFHELFETVQSSLMFWF